MDTPLSPYCPNEQLYVFWENGFSDEEMDQLIEYAEVLQLQKGIVGSAGDVREDNSVRDSEIVFIQPNDHPVIRMFYDRMSYIVNKVNHEFFQTDIEAIGDFQYTKYRAPAGHYSWHMDTGDNNGRYQRKLSMVMQLSNPDEYEGGELELLLGGEPDKAFKVPKKRGLVTVFPSYLLHRVAPTTSGIRLSPNNFTSSAGLIYFTSLYSLVSSSPSIS